jgi:hypothetical protein
VLCVYEVAAKFHATAMKAGLGGSDGDAAQVGNLRGGKSLDVVEDDHDTLVEGKGAKSVSQNGEVPAGMGLGWLGGRNGDSSGVDRYRGGAAAPGAHERRVGRNAVQPRANGGLTPVAVEVTPHRDERVLEGFFDIPRVVKQPCEDGPYTVLVPFNEGGEGRVVPGA